MYSPPFHRRILPWIFTAIFLAAAPALLFYTAGYRWNAKKDRIERNGTFIFDSTPSGARILLNGQATGEKTPITIQNVAPGKYTVRFEKDGYLPWEKELDVKPEYVTFANDIWMWKQSDAVLLNSVSSTRMQASPDQKTIALLDTGRPQPRLSIWTVDNGVTDTFTFPKPLAISLRMVWSDDSKSILIENPLATTTQAWLVLIQHGAQPTVLPNGTYHWTSAGLEGKNGRDQITIRSADGSITRTPLPPGIEDSYQNTTLRHATGTASLVLFQNSAPDRGLILPEGNWSIVDNLNSTLILRDGTHWLSVDPSADSPTIQRAEGDVLRPFVEKGVTTYLLVNGGEVWQWDPAHDPELLVRDSHPILQSAWHSAGRDVAIATDNSISMLNLDPRDGRIRTTLATFDRVNDMTIVKKNIYISGTKNGQTGLWSLAIE